MKFAALLLLAFFLTQDELKRPAAIKVQDVPPVPREVYDRLMQYQNVRAAQFRRWTPDGRSVLITTRFGSTSQLHLVHAAGGRREQVTFFDDAVGEAAVAKDGSILFEMAKEGDENF